MNLGDLVNISTCGCKVSLLARNRESTSMYIPSEHKHMRMQSAFTREKGAYIGGERICVTIDGVKP